MVKRYKLIDLDTGKEIGKFFSATSASRRAELDGLESFSIEKIEEIGKSLILGASGEYTSIDGEL